MTISWNAIDALAECGVGEGWEERVGGGVQVSMAEQWSKTRYVPRKIVGLQPSSLTDSQSGLRHHCCPRHHYRLFLSNRTTGPTRPRSRDPWRAPLSVLRYTRFQDAC